MRPAAIAAALMFVAVVGCEADSSPRIGTGEDSGVVFAPDTVWEYHLTLDAGDLAGLDNITYVHAEFRCGSSVLPDVGVRYKGNSSYWMGAPKYSFKVDFNRYVQGQVFYGLKKLNFNNNFKDPSLMRERLGYGLHRTAGVVAPRTAHANLYVNGTYMGVYTVIEQVDKTFLSDRLGDDTGNLYKGHGPFGTLEWLGPDPALYRDAYELKTNEVAGDYSRLVHFLDVLNNTADPAFEAAIEQVFNVDSFLSWLAVEVLLSHLDNYLGTANNYYLYDNPVTGKFEFIPWDVNEEFGNFKAGWSADEILALDIYQPFGRGWGGGGGGTVLFDVYQAGQSDAIAVGRDGFSTRYDGVQWTPVPTGVNFPLFGLWGTAMDNVVAVGDAGTVLRFDGFGWTPENSNVPEVLLGVWGADGANIFAVGDAQRVTRYDGNFWTPVSGGFGPPLIDVWGSSATNVFCSGGGVIVHYDGNVWEPMPLPFPGPPAPPPPPFFGIWGSGPGNVFAVGAAGIILRYNGNFWDFMPSPTPEFLKGIWGAAADDIFAVGDGGTILHFDGVDWTPMPSGIVENLEAVSGISGSDVFAVGAGGTILHYDGVGWTPMVSGAPPGPGAGRPLVTRILNVQAYLQAYEDKLRALIAGPYSQATMDAEIDAIYNLISADVLTDTMKPFSNQEFVSSIVQDIPPVGPDRILGLKPFVSARMANVLSQLP